MGGGRWGQRSSASPDKETSWILSICIHAFKGCVYSNREEIMLCSSQLLITGHLIQPPCEIPANIPYSHFQAYLHTNKYYKLVCLFFKRGGES